MVENIMMLHERFGGLVTRRFVGFVLSGVLLYLKPEQAVHVTILFGLLIGVTTIDSFTMKRKD